MVLAMCVDDPVSFNQAFDGSFTTKDVRLDLTYFKCLLNDHFIVIADKI
jgi:hypothetical protein